jgi:methylated-DNA-[protein]-cysteine S-methyltransferase
MSVKVAVGRIRGGPPGETWVAAGSRGVVAIHLGRGRRKFIKMLKRRGFAPGGPGSWVAPALRQISEYYAGRRRRFSLKVCADELAPFTSRVVACLKKVPYGVTVTYSELARKAGSPRASRAVGNVMANNDLPLVIPCHRVVASGGLGGFGGGLRMKRDLLRLEGARLP